MLACGEDLGSRMKSRVRDPECSVAAVGSHISAEDNGWSYMRSGSFSQTGRIRRRIVGVFLLWE